MLTCCTIESDLEKEVDSKKATRILAYGGEGAVTRTSLGTGARELKVNWMIEDKLGLMEISDATSNRCYLMSSDKGDYTLERENKPDTIVDFGPNTDYGYFNAKRMEDALSAGTWIAYYPYMDPIAILGPTTVVNRKTVDTPPRYNSVVTFPLAKLNQKGFDNSTHISDNDWLVSGRVPIKQESIEDGMINGVFVMNHMLSLIEFNVSLSDIAEYDFGLQNITLESSIPCFATNIYFSEQGDFKVHTNYAKIASVDMSEDPVESTLIWPTDGDWGQTPGKAFMLARQEVPSQNMTLKMTLKYYGDYEYINYTTLPIQTTFSLTGDYKLKPGHKYVMDVQILVDENQPLNSTVAITLR